MNERRCCNPSSAEPCGMGPLQRSSAGEGVFNPDNPLGGSSSLRECWRSVYGHFAACSASIDQAMDFSQSAKLSRNPPRHHLASQRIIWVEANVKPNLGTCYRLCFHRNFDTRVGTQPRGFVDSFPGKFRLIPAKMTVGRGFFINWSKQIERMNDCPRP